MNNHQALNRNEKIRDGYQKIIDDIKRQIAEEERPKVGDTVQIVPPHESTWWAGEAVVISDRHDGLGQWLKFKTEELAWFEYHRIKVVPRAAPKSRRWYTKEEFMAFMFAHPVILVRGKGQFNTYSGNPKVSESRRYVVTAVCDDVDSDNFRAHEYSVDGVAWLDFGVEDHK